MSENETDNVIKETEKLTAAFMAKILSERDELRAALEGIDKYFVYLNTLVHLDGEADGAKEALLKVKVTLARHAKKKG